MIKYENGTLCSSSGDIFKAGKINGAAVIYRHHLIFAMHYGYVPDRVGRVDSDVTNDRIDNLYDMAFGKPVVTHKPVNNDQLLAIWERQPLITDRERHAIMRPLPDSVFSAVLGFFRSNETFVPIGDTVVDQATGGIRIRRFVVERMVSSGDLCYDGACYRLTSQAT